MRFTIILPLVASLITGGAAAQVDATARGVQVRINGDLVVEPDARDELAIVVRGDARIHGAVRALIVVEGNVILDGAQVEDMTIIRGHGDVLEGTTVSGNIHLVDADVSIDEGATVVGGIDRGYSWQILRGFWFLAAIFTLGLTIAIVLSGLVAAGVAPQPLRRAGDALTEEIGKTMLAALVVWVALPIIAVALFATIIGIPTALGFFVFVMPTLGFLGYLVTGTRLGDWIISRVRGQVEPIHPYLAALIGLGILLVAARIPFLGAIVTPLAGIVGGGAIGLIAWRTMRPVRLPVDAALSSAPEPRQIAPQVRSTPHQTA